MRIEQIDIRNYKSLCDITIYSKDILSLVGRNNSGKSNVLKALQLFFEGSTRLVNNECFYCGITTDPIEITVTFDHLKPEELEEFETYINEEKIVLNRQIIFNGGRYNIINYFIINGTRKKLSNKDFNDILPDYIYVPAVRYISEETKQFGKLITPVLKKMPEKRKEELSEKLNKLSDGLNRSEERIDEIQKIETLLNDLMCEIMDCDIEIIVILLTFYLNELINPVTRITHFSHPNEL